MAAKKHSRLHSLEFATDGLSGTYNDLNSLREATLNETKTMSDSTTREDGQWMSFLNGLKSATISANCAWDESDTVLTTLVDAYDDNTTLHVRWRHDNSGGLRQARAEVLVSSMTRGAPTDDTQTIDIEFQITGSVTYDTQ